MSDLDSLRIDPEAQEAQRHDRSVPGRLLALIAAVVVLAALMIASVFVGSGGFSPSEVWESLTDPVGSTRDTIIRDYRVPRTLLAAMAGAALGVSGAVIQALTRNPLADPGILGVNAGAYFMVVVGAAFFGITGVSSNVLWGMSGAAIAAVVVYVIGSAGRAGGTPARMVLAGVAFGSVLTGLSHGITLMLPAVFDKVRYWEVGSVQNRQMDSVTGIAVFIAIGLLLSFVLASSLNALALGEDLATTLGARIGWTRTGSFVAITLLCGACTAAVGPILFVGLMVPHIARGLVGVDQRWVFSACLLIGPILFVAADMVGRVIARTEIPVGIVTAFIGAPVLVWLVRRGKAAPQ